MKMKKGLKVTVIFCIFLILSVVTIVPTVNAQEIQKIGIKDKYATALVKYCEKRIIPRYERYVFNDMTKEEVNEITDDITKEFKNLTDGQMTGELEIILYLVSLIIAFFYLLFGTNGFSFSACMLTTVIVMFIPIMVISLIAAIFEGGAFGIAFALSIFDAETIADLLHWYGVLGCFFIVCVLAPIFMLVYLLAIPVITVVNMTLFFGYIFQYIGEHFPMP